MLSPGLSGCASLVVDQTGVGAPVVDLFERAGLEPVGVLIHGGDRASNEGKSWRVPKRDLIGVLQVLLQTERLKVAGKLKLGPVLSQEMLNFRVKIDPMTAHESYSAWREEDHDDLVLSVALAAWWGENGSREMPIVRPGVGEDEVEVEESDGVNEIGICYLSDALIMEPNASLAVISNGCGTPRFKQHGIQGAAA